VIRGRRLRGSRRRKKRRREMKVLITFTIKSGMLEGRRVSGSLGSRRL
jgi:hypothetical protein